MKKIILSFIICLFIGPALYAASVSIADTNSRVKLANGGTGGVTSTIGAAIATSTNPGAITFGRANADNTFTWLSASDFRTALGLGALSTVTPGANVATFLATPNSSNFFGMISDEGNFISTLWDDADASTARTTLGLAIGTNVQAYDADLTTYAGSTPAANVLTWVVTPSSTNFAAAVTGETGSGALMFGTSPTITTSLLMSNGSDLRVGSTTTAHEWSISLYDVNDTTWRDAFTFSNGDTPTVTAGAVTFDFTGAGAISMGPLVFADTDGSPSTVGHLRYDNTVTNIDDGGFQWYDDDEVKLLIDMSLATASACSDDYVIAYDAAIDKWYCKADADSGGSTALNAIGDAAADGTIDQTGYKQIWTSTLNSAGSIWTFTNTTADLTADVSFMDFKYTDDGDANGYWLRGYDNSGNDLKWSIGVDGTFFLGTIELGHATANTLTASAGTLSIEGVNVVTTSSSDTLTNKTLNTAGTGNVITVPLNGVFDQAITDPADADDLIYAKSMNAVTITDIYCIAEGGGTITLTLQECDSTGASCGNIEGAITCDSNGAEDDGTLTDGSFAADGWIKALFSAPTGTVNSLAWSVKGTQEW